MGMPQREELPIDSFEDLTDSFEESSVASSEDPTESVEEPPIDSSEVQIESFVCQLQAHRLLREILSAPVVSYLHANSMI